MGLGGGLRCGIHGPGRAKSPRPRPKVDLFGWGWAEGWRVASTGQARPRAQGPGPRLIFLFGVGWGHRVRYLWPGLCPEPKAWAQARPLWMGLSGGLGCSTHGLGRAQNPRPGPKVDRFGWGWAGAWGAVLAARSGLTAPGPGPRLTSLDGVEGRAGVRYPRPGPGLEPKVWAQG